MELSSVPPLLPLSSFFPVFYTSIMLKLQLHFQHSVIYMCRDIAATGRSTGFSFLFPVEQVQIEPSRAIQQQALFSAEAF